MATTFLGRLKRDKRGNTLAMMAAFLIPVCALAGSAVDVARLYLVKVRLQQACDAGALAGRKFMVSDANATLDANAVTQAKTFFANNFPSGFMGTGAFTATTNPYPFEPTKTSDQQVAGKATATVPMTIMKMFSQEDQKMIVTCEARYDVADTDIMFVLDTTGSMACKPEDSDSACSASLDDAVIYNRPSSNTNGVTGYAGSTGYRVPEKMNGSTNISRIQALRTAVIDFYNTVAANVDPSTHVRYGFVTYSSMVNAGKAVMDVSSDYIIGGSGSGSWTYQSRVVNADYVKTYGTLSDVAGNKTKDQCAAMATVRNPVTAKIYASDGTATQTEYVWNNGGNNKCQMRTNTMGPQWIYQPTTWPVGPYVGGNEIADPTTVNGGKTRWMGCVEERKTTAGAKTFNNSSLPPDLDPDLVPYDDDTRWRPYWPAVEYERASYNKYPTTNGDNDSNESYMDPDRLKAGKNGCAKPVQRLKVVTATDVSNFVNAADFVPLGGTYHDIGMIWGVRLLSPTGIFAADTGAWPGRQSPKRIIVFLTDGAMAPSTDAYSIYGVENLDRRVTGGDTTTSRVDYHNARFLAECSKAKSMNIDIWTVAIAPAADTNLTTCATTSSQAFFTTSGSGLSDKFKLIAKQVAMLRVSK